MNNSQSTKKKTELLILAQAYLNSQINGFGSDLASDSINEEEADDVKRLVGHLVMLKTMICDLLEGLDKLQKHATHGLNGTQPSGYDEANSRRPYDAYAILLLELTDQVKLNVQHLPEPLKEALRELPAYLRDQISKQEELLNFPAFVLPDPSIVSPIPSQRAAANDQKYLESLEVAFLAEYFDKDLLKIWQIVEQRGSFQQILDLL